MIRAVILWHTTYMVRLTTVLGKRRLNAGWTAPQVLHRSVPCLLLALAKIYTSYIVSIYFRECHERPMPTGLRLKAYPV